MNVYCLFPTLLQGVEPKRDMGQNRSILPRRIPRTPRCRQPLPGDPLPLLNFFIMPYPLIVCGVDYWIQAVPKAREKEGE